MKIIYDKENTNFGIYVDRIINTDPYYRKLSNLELNFKEKEIKLINYNYKSGVKVNISFKNEVNNDFKKIFKKKGATVLDCTAGFGRDSYILAKYGFSVTMIEKNPITTLLLNNSIGKLLGGTEVYNRLKLIHGDSYDYLKLCDKQYDYIYIDFMFNKLKNSPLSSKNDETLKLISDDKENRMKLLNLAKKKCKDKVIIKNYKYSPSITGITPDYQIKTKLLNYYIFLSEYGSIKENI